MTSLRFKFAATVMFTLVVAMAVIFALQYRWLRDEMIERLGVSSTPLSGVIKASLRHAMQNETLSELSSIVETVSRQDGVLGVFILDKKGEVRFASAPDQVGTRIPLDDATCLICHRSAPDHRAKTVIFAAAGGTRVFRNVTAIANEPACHGCHPARDAVNGVLITDFSTAAVDAELARRLWHMLGALVVTVGATGVAIVVITNRLVIGRLERFVDATQRLARGTLDLVLPVRPRDEIGALAASFNEMVAGLRRTRELRERTELLESVLDNVHDAVVVVAPDETVIALNRAGEALFGVSAADHIGRPSRLLGDDHVTVLEHARTGRVYSTETKVRREDGVWVPALVHAVALTGDAGDLLAWVVVVRDLTEERLKDRLREQLLQSEKLAAVGRLAAGVAHELNNPLGNVLLYAKLLLEDLPPSDERRPDADRIVDNTLRCRAIVRALLDYARESETELDWRDPRELVERSVALVAGELTARGIRCDVRLSPDVPAVRCDGRQIEQVLVNVLENAIDAAGAAGAVTVTADVGPDGHAIRIRVQDSGPGVPADLRSRIFDPFYTTKPDGTGLGLAISSGIVARHRGRLVLATEPDDTAGGATFVVELPVNG
ncbi:MAG: PAS domain S-box protein [Candidatus Rokubacteria bacterium]|nr:PAS domain S-box protein [Candidatus Rokubacteria bacterium]